MAIAFFRLIIGRNALRSFFGGATTVQAFENDFDEHPDVWLTESSKPWSLGNAEWQRPAYYADEIPDELDLQDGE